MTEKESQPRTERKAKMKTLTLVLLAVMVAVTGYAQETKVVEPPKALVKAQEAYEKEAARVLEPVNMAYLRTLESIKKDLGVRGDTAGMVAVQAAIDEVKEYLKNEAGTEDGAEKMVVGTWEMGGRNNYKDTLIVNADGTWTASSNGETGKWKIKNGKWIITRGNNSYWSVALPLKKKMAVVSSFAGDWSFEKTSDKTK